MSKPSPIHRPDRLAPAINAGLQGWLSRIACSLAIALLAGVLAFLIARAITSVLLFAQQQQFLRETAGALRGGIDGLAGSNLRDLRLRVQQLDMRNEQLSLLVGFAVAAVAAVASYVWLERQHTVSETNGEERPAP